MRVYEFQCKHCDNVYQYDTPDAYPFCCGQTTKRKFSPQPIHFKTSGFYTTDSKD